MNFEYSNKVKDLQDKLTNFMNEHVYKNEAVYKEEVEKGGRWCVPKIMEDMKSKAKAQGLWNLFLPESDLGAGLTNTEYAPLCEIMGRSPIGAEVFNCSAPDTGNMEVLVRYGTKEQQNQWLTPLLNGEIRSAFAMTEPDVASSDASNIQASIDKNGDEYVINARKWWTSGAMDPRCKIMIFMGKTDPNADKYKQQSMILVPIDTPGVKVLRHLPVFGYDHAPHGHAEVDFKDVKVPVSNILLGEGRGFEIAQGRLGPGRIHHCMRLIGQAERALELMVKRAKSRVAFGKPISEHQAIRMKLSEMATELEAARQLVYYAASMNDSGKRCDLEAGMAKIKSAKAGEYVTREAMQILGGYGYSKEFPVERFWRDARVISIFEGTSEIQHEVIAKSLLSK